MFQTTEITSPDICEINCFVEADCVSFNVGPLQDGKYWCELSNSDHIGHPEGLVYGGISTIYRPVLVRKLCCLKMLSAAYRFVASNSVLKYTESTVSRTSMTYNYCENKDR